MSDSPTPPTSSRPRPVLLLAALIAGLDTLATVGKATGILSGTALAYVTLVSGIVAVVGAVLVQGVVTPLSAPRDAAGNALMPVAAIAPVVRAAAKAGAHAGATEAVTAAAPPVVSEEPTTSASGGTVIPGGPFPN